MRERYTQGYQWLDESIRRLTGQADLREAAIDIAGREIAKLLSFKDWKNFTGGVPIHDILLLHPEIDPQINSVDQEALKLQGLCTFEDGFHRISLSNALDYQGKSFVLAHELGHVVIREAARSLGYTVNALLNSKPEEDFCEGFARHILLPDLIIRPQLERSFNLHTIDHVLAQFRVTPDLLTGWLTDNQHILDRAKKGIVVSRWWGNPRHFYPKLPTIGFNFFAFPVWGGYSEPEDFRLSTVPNDILEKDYDTTNHYSVPVVSLKRDLQVRLRKEEPEHLIEGSNVEHKISYTKVHSDNRSSQVLMTVFDFPPIYSRQLELRLRFPWERINVENV